MADPADERRARNRWVAINLVRLSGVVLVLLGILTLNGTAGLPEVAGSVFLFLGLFNLLVLPAMLVRRWRTPRP